MGYQTPKQFLPLGSCPLIVHSLRTIQAVPAIREILLMVPAGAEREWRETIVDNYEITKVAQVLPGGPTRQDSVSTGLKHVASGTDIVVIHDAVRPFVSAELLMACIEGARQRGAAIAAVPVQDTLKRVTGDLIMATVDRRGLWIAQTPQAFRLPLLREAHRRAAEVGCDATDDAALVEWAGGTVQLVPGDPANVKITRPTDLRYAERLLASAAGVS